MHARLSPVVGGLACQELDPIALNIPEYFPSQSLRGAVEPEFFSPEDLLAMAGGGKGAAGAGIRDGEAGPAGEPRERHCCRRDACPCAGVRMQGSAGCLGGGWRLLWLSCFSHSGLPSAEALALGGCKKHLPYRRSVHLNPAVPRDGPGLVGLPSAAAAGTTKGSWFSQWFGRGDPNETSSDPGAGDEEGLQRPPRVRPQRSHCLLASPVGA